MSNPGSNWSTHTCSRTHTHTHTSRYCRRLTLKCSNQRSTRRFSSGWQQCSLVERSFGLRPFGVSPNHCAAGLAKSLLSGAIQKLPKSVGQKKEMSHSSCTDSLRLRKSLQYEAKCREFSASQPTGRLGSKHSQMYIYNRLAATYSVGGGGLNCGLDFFLRCQILESSYVAASLLR